MRDDLRHQLQAIDERLADVPLPPALERRVMASIREPSNGSPRLLVAAAVLAAIVLAFALGLRLRSEPTTLPAHDGAVTTAPSLVAAPVEPPTAPIATTPRAWDGALAFTTPQCRFAAGEAELQVEDGCRMTLADPALAMDTWARTRLARTEHGVRVIEGNVAFAVEHVADGAPRVRIEVAAGAIEVIGTRFVVVQHGTTGHVDLLEGAIAFVDHEGREHALVPGRRLRWSEGRVVETRAAAPARPGASASPAFELDATLEKVAALRRAGRYRDAVDVLHRARRSLGDGEGAEILSFEEGTLREHDTGGPAMCAFWRGHLARFSDGDYTAAVRSRLARAGCEAP